MSTLKERVSPFQQSRSTRAVFLWLLVPCVLCVAFPASAEASAASKRSKVVSYMRSMATIQWTPENEISYWKPWNGFNFKVGTVYTGVPYTQYGRETNLKQFKGFLKKEGKQKPKYTGPTNSGGYRGSDCSSAVSMAWQQADPEFPICWTGILFPEHNARVVKVGDYAVTANNSTAKIVQDNGAEKIKAAYAKLKPGDAVFNHAPSGAGHVRLVVKVNPKKKEVITIEQTGKNPNGAEGTNSTWRVDKAYSFDELLGTNYLPISLKAFGTSTPKKKKQK